MTKKKKVVKKTAKRSNAPLSVAVQERIKKLVASKKHTRTEIATKLKVSLGTVAKYAASPVKRVSVSTTTPAT